jgi:hypothetical protein
MQHQLFRGTFNGVQITALTDILSGSLWHTSDVKIKTFIISRGRQSTAVQDDYQCRSKRMLTLYLMFDASRILIGHGDSGEGFGRQLDGKACQWVSVYVPDDLTRCLIAVSVK